MSFINIARTEKRPQTELITDHNILCPSYAQWFSADAVHDIERRSLPEFFVSEDLASTYLSIRQFMVDRYRSRPSEYLSVSMCRRMLASDIGSIYRVHSFLEQWGLINYHFNTSLSSSTNEPGVAFVTPKGTHSHHGSLLALQTGTKRKRICVACGAECTKGFYGLIKATLANPLLCPECFSDGHLVEGTSSPEYCFVDTPLSSVANAQPWNEAEELKLLEAIEEFQNDWNKVSEAVGRPKDQCILHFIQLDNIEYERGNDDSGNGIGTADSIPKVSPFANLENPVIGTVAFLASLINPKIAATAAKAAIQALSPDVSATHSAAAASFALAATKAHEMAQDEERIIEELRDAIVLAQMKKVQLKLAYLEGLEKNVLEEKAELEKQRMVLFLERVNLKKAIMGMEGKFVRRTAATVSASEGDNTQAPSPSIHTISDNTNVDQ